jgi:cell division inhibitor SepF
MGFFDRFLDAIRLNDDYDDDEFYDDEEDDFDEDYDDYEEEKPKKRFFDKFSKKSYDDDFDEDEDDFADDDEEFDDFDDSPRPARKSSNSSSISARQNAAKARRDREREKEREAREREKAAKKAKASKSKKGGAAQMGLNVIRPSSMEDTKDIADFLKESRPVVLNLEGIDIDMAQRIIDFTCGVCYALDGDLQIVSNYIYLITPDGVDTYGDVQSLLIGSDFEIPSMRSPY